MHQPMHMAGEGNPYSIFRNTADRDLAYTLSTSVTPSVGKSLKYLLSGDFDTFRHGLLDISNA
jgi:hypothetical protein